MAIKQEIVNVDDIPRRKSWNRGDGPDCVELAHAVFSLKEGEALKLWDNPGDTKEIRRVEFRIRNVVGRSSLKGKVDVMRRGKMLFLKRRSNDV